MRSAMTEAVVTVGPEHTLKQAAERMSDHNVGSAIVNDPDGVGPGIVTERDILHAVAAGKNLDEELVEDHAAQEATVTSPDTDLDEAAAAMVRGGFRHIIVMDGTDIVGIVSMRDVVRRWVEERANL